MTTAEKIRYLYARYPDQSLDWVAWNVKVPVSRVKLVLSRRARRGRPPAKPLCPTCGGTGRDATKLQHEETP